MRTSSSGSRAKAIGDLPFVAHVREVVHFADWAEAEGLALRDLDRGALNRLCSQLAERNSLRYPCGKQRQICHSACLWIDFLEAVGAVETCPPHRSAQEPALLLQFREWMRTQRGTLDTTLNKYRLPIIDLLDDLGTEPQNASFPRKARPFAFDDGASKESSLRRHPSTSHQLPWSPSDAYPAAASRPFGGSAPCRPGSSRKASANSPVRAASITCSWSRRGSRSRCRPRSLAWVGGRFSPSRCFRLRRRTDRHHRTRAPTRLLQAASRGSPGPLPFEDRLASNRSRHLPRCRARALRRSR
jgi:hypothetical protein